MRALGPVLALLILGALVVSGTLITVDQRQNAIVFQLGEVKEVITKPGLNFKWPMIQNVRHFDMRILSYDDIEPMRFITSEKKPVLVDSFVKWRITDVRQYYISVQGDEFRAATRIKQTISDSLQAEFGKRTVHDVVSGQRDDIMALVRDKVDQDLRRIGVEIIDVRLKRVDLPQEVSESVYRRMEAERKRVANELRSEGSAEAERIRADADRQREVILANAYRAAQGVRGDGDARAASTYAQAFSQNPEFYAFYRSMEAYRSTFRGKGDIMLLEPNSDFFRYLKDAAGKAPAQRK
jgi:modulator of FtsH protease HflC